MGLEAGQRNAKASVDDAVRGAAEESKDEATSSMDDTLLSLPKSA